MIRLKDNLGRVSRRGQNAIAIALQIALYPVYLLVQSLRMTANQLGNSLQKQLSPPGKEGTDAITASDPIGATSAPFLVGGVALGSQPTGLYTGLIDDSYLRA